MSRRSSRSRARRFRCGRRAQASSATSRLRQAGAGASAPGEDMAGTIQCGHRGRKDFGKIPSIVEIPNLIRSEEHTSELQSLAYLVCRLLLEKKKNTTTTTTLAISTKTH